MSVYLINNDSPTSRGQYTEVFSIDTEAAVFVTITCTNIKSISSIVATPVNPAAAAAAAGVYSDITEGNSVSSVKFNVGANNAQFRVSITGAI